MFNLIRLIRLIALFIVLGGLAATAQDDLVEERILLTFIPNIQFAPFYLGIEDGHFDAVGYEVTLEHLQEPDVLDLVAVGQADFGIVSGEQVILARSRGRDVVYVFEWFQQYPVGIVSAGHNGVGLDNIGDLRGRKVGIPGRFGASYSGLTALLHSAGLTEDDIEIVEIGFNAPEAFCLKVVDAAVVYINNEPLQIVNRSLAGECSDIGIPDVLAVASYVDLVSNGLIVNQVFLDEKPDQVARMVLALQNALQSSINNPASAYLASLPYVDTLPADEELIAALSAAAERQQEFLASSPTRAEVAESRPAMLRQLLGQFDVGELAQFEVLLNSIELWDADELGFSDLASWEAMRDTLALMGFLGDDLGDLDYAFTNEFVLVSDE